VIKAKVSRSEGSERSELPNVLFFMTIETLYLSLRSSPNPFCDLLRSSQLDVLEAENERIEEEFEMRRKEEEKKEAKKKQAEEEEEAKKEAEEKELSEAEDLEAKKEVERGDLEVRDEAEKDR